MCGASARAGPEPVSAAPGCDPFFIVGTERSGSNLLRLILHSHPRLAIPHPPHLIRYFRPLQPGYGLDGTVNTGFLRLVSDVRRLLDRHIYPWDVPVDWDRVAQEARPRDCYGVQYALYAQYAAAKGKARWGCKSTFLIDSVPEILGHHPGARFLWLVRDPRDVAASSRRSVFSPSHPLFCAELWRDQQALGLRREREAPAAFLRVLYEDLIAEPEREVRRICSFLQEEFHPAMLQHERTPEAKRSGSLSESWANTARPIQKDRAGGYKKGLSAAEIALVEMVTAPEMAALGYAPAGPPRQTPVGRLERARYRLADRAADLRIEWRSLRRDSNVWRRWRRALLLRRLRWRRGGAGPVDGGEP